MIAGRPAVIVGKPAVIAGTPSVIAGTPAVPVFLASAIQIFGK